MSETQPVTEEETQPPTQEPTETATVNISKNASSPTLNILTGSISFQLNGEELQYKQGDGEWITYTGTATIEQDNIDTATQNTITVYSGEHNIILNSVNIDISDSPSVSAFNIQENSIVNLTLAEKSVNTLKSGANRAGIQAQTKSGYTATVNIDGSGQLTATGGGDIASLNGTASGIGGGYKADGGIITITGDVKISATGISNAAGIGGGNYGTGGDITISGNAQVTANGVLNGAGIGGGVDGAGGNITITGNAKVTATSGSNGAGIGGGYRGAGGTITLSEYADVTAVGGEIYNNNYKYSSAIGSGGYYYNSTKADGAILAIGVNTKVIAVTNGDLAIDAQDSKIIKPSENEAVANILDLVYLYETTGKSELYDASTKLYEYTSENEYKSIAFIGSLEQDKIYTVKINNTIAQGKKANQEPTNEFILDSNFTTYVDVLDVSNSIVNNPTLDLSQGEIIIYQQDDGSKIYKIGTELWQKYSGELTIEQSNKDTSTQNTITVLSGEHDITLNGVNIDVSEISNTCAFDIQGTSNVTLTLANNSENTLKSGQNFAGLQVQTIDNVTASVAIKGEGMLSANGGNSAAGIGGGNLGAGGTIAISGSTQITAIGGSDGAGIGGGNLGAGGSITISENSDVTAVGGRRNSTSNIYPSAIGSGGYYNTLTKSDGATLLIGSNTKVKAVAQGVETQAIDAL